jgi:hypothetical protein
MFNPLTNWEIAWVRRDMLLTRPWSGSSTLVSTVSGGTFETAYVTQTELQRR